MTKSKKTGRTKLFKADVKWGAVAVVGNPPLLTAAQIKEDCPDRIQELGKRIAAHYDKLVQYEGKANEHKIAMCQLLVQAKAACDAGGFRAFHERFCPNLGKSRTHELLRIAAGKSTIEQTKSATRQRVKKHRAAQKAAAAKILSPAPSVTVTDEDPVISEAMHQAPKSEADIDAEIRRLEAECAARINATMQDGKIGRTASVKALTEFDVACRTWLPKMHGRELHEAINNFFEIVRGLRQKN